MRVLLALALVVVGFTLTALVRSPVGTVSGTVTVEGARPEGTVVYLLPVDEVVRAKPGRTVIDQRRLRFVPVVVTVPPGAEVAFHNSDPLLHNIFSPDAREPFDLGTYPEGEARSHRFETPGPHVILCNIHPEMEAWVFVTLAPHSVVVGSDGTFRMEVPAGRYRIGAWHRRARAGEREIEVREGGETRLDLRLEPPPAR